jgi:flagellar biosynthesis protein FliR
MTFPFFFSRTVDIAVAVALATALAYAVVSVGPSAIARWF